jgi:uncharacterized protein YlxP (DUF503 family)
MTLGVLSLLLSIPGCASLKEKRSRLKPLLARLQREFNISVAEIDLQDTWQEAVIACAVVNSSATQVQRSLQSVLKWIEEYWPDVEVFDHKIELR